MRTIVYRSMSSKRLRRQTRTSYKTTMITRSRRNTTRSTRTTIHYSTIRCYKRTGLTSTRISITSIMTINWRIANYFSYNIITKTRIYKTTSRLKRCKNRNVSSLAQNQTNNSYLKNIRSKRRTFSIFKSYFYTMTFPYSKRFKINFTPYNRITLPLRNFTIRYVNTLARRYVSFFKCMRTLIEVRTRYFLCRTCFIFARKYTITKNDTLLIKTTFASYYFNSSSNKNTTRLMNFTRNFISQIRIISIAFWSTPTMKLRTRYSVSKNKRYNQTFSYSFIKIMSRRRTFRLRITNWNTNFITSTFFRISVTTGSSYTIVSKNRNFLEYTRTLYRRTLYRYRTSTINSTLTRKTNQNFGTKNLSRLKITKNTTSRLTRNTSVIRYRNMTKRVR